METWVNWSYLIKEGSLNKEISSTRELISFLLFVYFCFVPQQRCPGIMPHRMLWTELRQALCKANALHTLLCLQPKGTYFQVQGKIDKMLLRWCLAAFFMSPKDKTKKLHVKNHPTTQQPSNIWVRSDCKQNWRKYKGRLFWTRNGDTWSDTWSDRWMEYFRLWLS